MYHDYYIFVKFQALKISILGLNTRSKRETESGYRNNYVCCLCSERKLQKVVQALEENDAIKVTTGKL